MKEYRFDPELMLTVNNAAAMAEELVSDYYKMSASQWLNRRYDIKTVHNLKPEEIVYGPFAQIIRYEAQRQDSALNTGTFDFYTICLQDHAILKTLAENEQLSLFPFSLYIVAHELIHIVRFSRFIQGFEASEEERNVEEVRVHTITHLILEKENVPGMSHVLNFFKQWRGPLENVSRS